jgi:CRISPR/Cas system-associated exonuclease Cas4 (RecB family)
MSTFLGELAQHILVKYPDNLSELQIIFPNRRAGAYLRRALGQQIKDPVWMPRIFTMEEFVLSKSSLQTVDKLEGVFTLYEIYKKHQPEAERFDKFFFWGEMILKDFEEIDQYLVNPERLFTTIRSQKELDEAFFFMDEEDRRIIEEFWSTFLPDVDTAQERFLKTWEILHPIYQEYRQCLVEQGKGYNGLIYRQLAEHIEAQKIHDGVPVIFAGFNALTAAEEQIISWYVSELQAEVHWDLDGYYVDAEIHEAGFFFREYRRSSVLNRTFPKELPRRLEESGKQFTMTGVALEVGQAKAVTQRLEDLMQLTDFDPDRTVLVLPHEHMLQPVLHAIPPSIEHLNITMGYPLNASNAFGLIDSLLKMQHNHRVHQEHGLSFYHKPLTELLQHPLIFALDEEGISATLNAIKTKNLIQVYIEEVSSQHEFVQSILKVHSDGLDFVLDCLVMLDTLWEGQDLDFELEFLRRYYQAYAQLRSMISQRNEQLSYEFLISLHRKISGSLKVPFSGEPLKGLQVMGILETRNLDFDHVIVCNMNEDSWPAASHKGSFVPFNIRKAFDMPVHDHQDAIYSYLFYRLIQRTRTADFFYNTVSEFGVSGEQSRFLRQLVHESVHEISSGLLVSEVILPVNQSITIEKSQEVFSKLNRFVKGGELPEGVEKYGKLTPSAIENYLYCRLRFYFRYIVQLYEADELQEDMDPMLFGNILHDTMELLYKEYLEKQSKSEIDEGDFKVLESNVDDAVIQAFRKQYRYQDSSKFQLEGRSVIAFDVIKKIIRRILTIDKQYAPFEVIGLEADSEAGYGKNIEIQSGDRTIAILLEGKIDRIDRKDGTYRIVDYKTGRDQKRFNSIAGLTDRGNKDRNKAAFQVLYYSWMLKNSGVYENGSPIVPGLFNNRELFQPDFDWRIFAKEGYAAPVYIDDFRMVEEEFEEELRNVLTEIWDPSIPFDQVEDAKKCEHCPYSGICKRN